MTHNIKLRISVLNSFSAALVVNVFAADDVRPAWTRTPDINGIIQNVPKLTRPLPKSFQLTLCWWQVPLSFDNAGKLKNELTALKKRGVVPVIGLKAEYNVRPEITEKQIQECEAIAAAGFPVHIQMIGGLDLYRMPDGSKARHTDSLDKEKKDAVGQEFPCLVIKEGWKARADHIRKLMRKLKDADVQVTAVWYDYEAHPHPWNGIMEHSKRCPSCQKEIPAEALQSFNHFVGWACDLRDQALVEGFAKPVREVFPKARIGFYGFRPSTKKYPLLGGERNPAEIDVAMPSCYARANMLGAFYHVGWGLTRTETDPLFFLEELNRISGITANLRQDQVLIPFVCTWSERKWNMKRSGKRKGDNAISRKCLLYREFLRHTLLRGAKGFYCFNVAPPYGSMANYYNDLAEINSVLDEMSVFADFFDGGEVITHESPVLATEKSVDKDWTNPRVKNTETWSRMGVVDGIRKLFPVPKRKAPVVWSGIRKGGKALIRVVALGNEARFTHITPFLDMTVKVIAPPSGKTYIIEKSGKIETFN